MNDEIQAVIVETLREEFDKLRARLDKPTQEWFQPKDVATLTGLSKRHVMRAIKQGRLLCSNIGGDGRPTYRIAREDIESWMRTSRLRVGVTRSARRAMVDEVFGKKTTRRPASGASSGPPAPRA